MSSQNFIPTRGISPTHNLSCTLQGGCPLCSGLAFQAVSILWHLQPTWSSTFEESIDHLLAGLGKRLCLLHPFLVLSSGHSKPFSSLRLSILYCHHSGPTLSALKSELTFLLGFSRCSSLRLRCL